MAREATAVHLAAACALVVVGAFLVLERRRALGEELVAQEAAARALVPPGRRVERIHLQRAGEAPLLLERARGGRWRARLGGPTGPALPADAATSEALALALASLRVERWLDSPAGSKAAPLAAQGLAPPLVTLGVTDDLGALRILGVGRRAEAEPLVFVLVDGRAGAASATLLAAAGREAWDFLGRELLDLPWGYLTLVEIRRPAGPGASAELVVRRGDGGTFTVEAPKGSPPRAGAAPWLGGLASRLERLEATGFGPLAPTPADLTALGLAPPRLEVSLGGPSGPPTRLAIGNSANASSDGGEAGTTWARLGQGPVASIATALVDDLLREDLAFAPGPP